MNMVKPGAELFVPDFTPLCACKALKRTTHLAISAHQDDLEIMAYDGILKCFGRSDAWFTGVVVTNGAGSPRDDLYADYDDERMQLVRRDEQKKAAIVGEFAALALLMHTSAEVKDAANPDVVAEIKELLEATMPDVVYTHNLGDKHDTHVSVALRVIAAIRSLPKDKRPKKLYGCEVWRALDWMMDNEKVSFDVSAHPNLAAALLGVFDSQICGGKRYDLASVGRRIANATYADSHGVDLSDSLINAMDLTPLIEDDSLDIAAYVTGYIERFLSDVKGKLTKFS